MKTYSRLLLTFLLLILVAPQVRADEPPKDGKHVEYYENGKKKIESHYKDSKLDGVQTTWHKNGQKRSEAHYASGDKVPLPVWRFDIDLEPESERDVFQEMIDDDHEDDIEELGDDEENEIFVIDDDYEKLEELFDDSYEELELEEDEEQEPEDIEDPYQDAIGSTAKPMALRLGGDRTARSG